MQFPNKNKCLKVFSVFMTMTNDALTIVTLYYPGHSATALCHLFMLSGPE